VQGGCSIEQLSGYAADRGSAKHTDDDKPEWVPAAGLEAVARSFARVVDQVRSTRSIAGISSRHRGQVRRPQSGSGSRTNRYKRRWSAASLPSCALLEQFGLRTCVRAGCPGRVLHDFRRTAVRSSAPEFPSPSRCRWQGTRLGACLSDTISWASATSARLAGVSTSRQGQSGKIRGLARKA